MEKAAVIADILVVSCIDSYSSDEEKKSIFSEIVKHVASRYHVKIKEMYRIMLELAKEADKEREKLILKMLR